MYPRWVYYDPIRKESLLVPVVLVSFQKFRLPVHEDKGYQPCPFSMPPMISEKWPLDVRVDDCPVVVVPPW